MRTGGLTSETFFITLDVDQLTFRKAEFWGLAWTPTKYNKLFLGNSLCILVNAADHGSYSSASTSTIQNPPLNNRKTRIS
jgi:hypothetical protein